MRGMSLYVFDGDDKQFYTDPVAILAALADAGVLKRDPTKGPDYTRYVSPWEHTQTKLEVAE
jgi:hypothetical protein